MAGINTFKDGLHRSRIGRAVPIIEFTDNEWEVLEKIAGCKFDSNLRDRIKRELSLIKEENKWILEKPKFQDIKRTLTRISKLKPDDALIAEENCDSFTIALLDEVTWADFKKFANQVSGEKIILAAQKSLEKLPDSRGGRPNNYYLNALAKYSVEIWIKTGNTNLKAWAKVDDENITPLVKFSSILFKKVKSVEHDESDIAKRLRSYLLKR